MSSGSVKCADVVNGAPVGGVDSEVEVEECNDTSTEKTLGQCDTFSGTICKVSLKPCFLFR